MLCFLHLLLRLLRCRLRLLPLAVLYRHSNIRLLYLWKAVMLRYRLLPQVHRLIR